MFDNQVSTQDVVIWGVSLPLVALQEGDINYLKRVVSLNRPSVEWMWHEMDRVWDAFGLDNRVTLKEQAIRDYYSHPVWLLNGVFSAVDPVSIQHRDSIATYVSNIEAKRVADFGGGFGELALKLHAVAPKILIDIVEPYPSKVGMLRVADKSEIQFINELNGPYDCVLVQDVLEHVEKPLELTKEIVQATKKGGYLIFANCFYPVIKCHLPSTFYLRHTFSWVVKGLGLNFEGRVKGAEHALVFKRVGKINISKVILFDLVSKFVAPLLNAMIPQGNAILFKLTKNDRESTNT